MIEAKIPIESELEQALSQTEEVVNNEVKAVTLRSGKIADGVKERNSNENQS